MRAELSDDLVLKLIPILDDWLKVNKDSEIENFLDRLEARSKFIKFKVWELQQEEKLAKQQQVIEPMTPEEIQAEFEKAAKQREERLKNDT